MAHKTEHFYQMFIVDFVEKNIEHIIQNRKWSMRLARKLL